MLNPGSVDHLMAFQHRPLNISSEDLKYLKEKYIKNKNKEITFNHVNLAINLM